MRNLRIALQIMVLSGFVFGIGAVNSVSAQSETLTFARVEVALWPEFDRPSMLVIYQLTISPLLSLPAEVNLRIPLSAGKPNAVAARQPDGMLVNIPYEQSDTGTWSTLHFQATSPEIQVEYYDSLDRGEGDQRSYLYQWAGDYAVESFAIQVQQPVGAEQMNITPALGQGVAAEDGLVYYNSELGSLSQGQSFQLQIEYNKEGSDLSANSMPVEPSAPLDENTPGRQTMLTVLPWVFGVVGLLLIVGGGLWYWQSSRQVEQPKKRRRTRRKPATIQALDAGEEYVYCHQCGKRAESGDLFCRACGTALKR